MKVYYPMALAWELALISLFMVSIVTLLNLKLSTRESGYFNSFLTLVWCHSMESKSIVDKAIFVIF